MQTRFTGEHIGSEVPVSDIIQLDELLNELEKIDPVYVKLFEARAFAGMTIDEAAELLELSPSTVKRKWKVTVAWLQEHLDGDGF